ncbi:MAG: hypothetical protein CBC09_08035 [Cellvibrionales bacterium TMED49]|nr:hypothetical protein [Porticoccaceae bacterium]OUU36854.1 MAG: hypothetical protein CBC09_08035 [Cellvibrionales bacterium TMED49]
MLGPEQVNFAVRPTPIFLEGTVSIDITEDVARDLSLRDGQIVRAVVGMRGEELRLSIGTRELVIGNRDLATVIGEQLKTGDRIDLRVTNNSTILQPLVSPGVGSAMASPGSRLMSLLFRPPQDSSLTQLFSPQSPLPGLQQIAEGENSRWLAQLIQSMARLSPEAVKRALIASGLFTEARISRQLLVPMDLKQILKSILRAQPSPSIIAGELESAVDEIEMRQVESLQAQQNRALSYSFLLPFNDANPVQIEFQRDPVGDDEKNADWVINLHTDSSVLGELWLKTTLKSSLRLDMEMWAARSDVAKLARSGSGELHRQLEEFGLALGKMTVHHARRPLAGISDEKPLGPGGVVDVIT